MHSSAIVITSSLVVATAAIVAIICILILGTKKENSDLDVDVDFNIHQDRDVPQQTPDLDFTLGPLLCGTATAQSVYITNTPLFQPNANLVKKWLRNAGHAVARRLAACDVHIIFVSAMPLDASAVKTARLKPTILVNTEQPSWPDQNRALLRAVHTIWCMDTEDYDFLRLDVGVPATRLHIVPTMFGTYVQSLPQTVGVPKTVDALQFGATHPRRTRIMQQLEDALPAQTVVSGGIYATELEDYLQQTRVVVAIHLYDEPRVFGIHRMMQVLQYPYIRIVAEESKGSVYTRMLLQQFGDRVVFAEYEDLVGAVRRVLAEPRLSVSRPEPACVQKLFDWDGQTSWLSVLS